MQGAGYANQAPYMAGAPYQGAAAQQQFGSQYGIQGYDNMNNYGGNPYAMEGANKLNGNSFRQNGYPDGNNNGVNPGMGSGFGSYGGYGMNSMGGFGSMSQASMYRMNEPPPVIYKLFSSRRDRFGLSSQRDFHTRHSRLSLYGFGHYGSSMRNSTMGSAFERDMPAAERDTGFAKYDESRMTDGRGLNRTRSPVQNANGDSQTLSNVGPTSNDRKPANGRSLSPTSYAFDDSGSINDVPKTNKRSSIGSGGPREGASQTTSADKKTQSEKLQKREKVTPSEKISERQKAVQPEKSQEREKDVPRDKAPEKVQPKQSIQEEKPKETPAPAIPLSREMSVAEHEPPRTNSAFGGAEDGGDPTLNQSENEEGSQSRIRSRSMRGSMRRRSSVNRARSISTVNMSIAEFPEGDEVRDILSAGIVGTRRASSIMGDLNSGQNRRRSSVAPKTAVAQQPPKVDEGNSQESQTQAEERKGVDRTARRPSEDARRQQQEQEQKEREERQKFDEETKRKNEEEREQRKAEDKKRFEEEREREQKEEEERINKLITQPEVTPKAPEGRRSTVRRSSRVRPSRANSMLGAIPEQPPDVEAGSVRDLLDGSLASGRASVVDINNPRRSIAYTGDTRPNQQEENERQRLEEQKRQQQEEEKRQQQEEEERKRREEERKQQQQQQQQQQRQDDQNQKEDHRQQHDDQQKDPRKSNPIKAVVLIEKHPQPSDILTTEGNSFTYRGVKHDATEVILRDPKSMSYHSKTFNSIKDFVCDGYNSSVVSVEAPNTGKVFDSPVWTGLTRIVRGVLQKSTNTSEHRTELAAAFGFIHKDKVRDLIVENSNFEQLMVHPSPIYGPRIPQLRYNPVASPSAFEEMMSSALRRATADPILSSMNGVAVALLLSKQYCLITNEAGEKTYDVLLSSLVVASTGSDTLPYDSALARVRNEYSMLFHLLLGGPCFTCFMLNLSMSEEDPSSQETMEKLIALHDKMQAAHNYPLRNGSVLRFVKYVETANKEGKERVKTEENPEKRSKLERYVQEQARLLSDAGKMLEEAREAMRGTSSA